MNLGDRIRKIRTDKGITMAQLAKATNTTAAAISRYELGQREPKMAILEKISAALNVSVLELLGFKSQEDLQNAVARQMILESKKGHLGEMQPAEITALIKSGDVVLGKDGKPQWNLKGPVSSSALDEDKRQQDLLIHFSSLNDKGQKKAVEQVEDLAKIPDYQKGKKPSEGK
ncbi:helix-turn-helix domain-containing protein [Caproiciproducens sp. R2]|uniref:helix-turn-helix domain-containing protein n=1 Tax=Caproiciproducens sp. R2 TaxID=3435187 RepID=UPI00403368FA